MKLLEREKVTTHTKARTLVAPRPVSKPTITVRARVVSRPVPRRGAGLGELCNRVVAFAAIVGVTYVGSTLGGYVMLERARQIARQGEQRAVYARAEAKAARASIEALTNPAGLRTWADAHGFEAGRSEAAPARVTGYVARL